MDGAGSATTVAGTVARQVLNLKYEDLPEEVVHQTKRVLLDTLACALSGVGSDAARIVESVVEDLAGRPEATVIGSGLRTNCADASLVNGVLARYADYMDNLLVFFGPKQYIMGGHAALFIPGVLALGERKRASGRDVIVGINIGHQLSGSFQSGDLFEAEKRTNTLHVRGFDARGTSSSLVMPFVAGKLLGLSVEEIENAVGISVAYGLQLGITDSPGKGVLLTMAKNLRYPIPIRAGIVAALLAQKGFTGPATAFEGPDGFIQVALGGHYVVEKFTAAWDRWYIKDTYLKYFWSEGAIQGTAAATLDVVETNNIRPEEVKAIKVKQHALIASEQGNPVLRRPPNKESADHSMYYVCARVICDRALWGEQYTPEKIADPAVNALIDNMTVEGEPSFDRYETEIEIKTKQGKTFTSHVVYPKGHPFNPFTDAEVEAKFRRAATNLLSEQRTNRILEAVYDLEKLTDIGSLMKMMAV